MTSSKSYLSILRRPHHLLATVFTFGCLLLLLASPSPLSAQDGETPTGTESEEVESDEQADPVDELIDPAELPAKAALALLVDNQKRVLDASPGISSLRMMTQGGSSASSAVDSVQSAKEAHASLRITAELVSDSRGLEAATYLARMQGAQERLLSLLESRAGSGQVSPISDASNGMLLVFAEAERQANALLPLTASERHTILLEYRERIKEAEIIARGGDPDAYFIDVDDDGRPITGKELAKKQEKYAEWLAENERRERELKEKRAERAKRLQQRQQQGGESSKAPSVGLNQEAMAKPLREKPSRKMQEKMELWHIGWSKHSEGLKAALTEFLRLPLKRHNTKAISICQHLYRSVVAISTDASTMEAPDPALRQALSTSISAIQEMSYACTYGKFDETRKHKAESQTALKQAVERLKVYGLSF